jgi:RNA polymerase sigma-70 factor (ECF subfamily)
MDQPEDFDLYLKLKNSDQVAFQVLFKKYYAGLCHFAHQFLKDRELAEETVQDMFVKFWDKRAGLNIESSVRHYFFRWVRNHCLNQLQHEKIKKRYADKVMEASGLEPDPGQYFIEVGLLQKIEKSIQSLPPKRQEIFRLSREHGLKYKEIAEELHISVKTVEAQMGLALKHLRDDLKEFSDHLISLFIFLRKKGVQK